MLVLLVNLVTAARAVAGEVVANVTQFFLPVECVVKGNYHFTTDYSRIWGLAIRMH